MADIERLKEVVNRLVAEGEQIRESATNFHSFGRPDKDLLNQVNHDYNRWYSQALVLARSHVPERSDEFVTVHGNNATDALTNFISGSGTVWPFKIDKFCSHLTSQIGILRSILDVVGLRLLDLRVLVAFDLMRNEIEAAKHLLENGFVRPAGAIAGVVLERHLRIMCENRNVQLGQKETVGALNEKLRDRYQDSANYRKVQWMSDVRALCDHEKGKEPAADQVAELIDAVNKFISTVS